MKKHLQRAVLIGVVLALAAIGVCVFCACGDPELPPVIGTVTFEKPDGNLIDIHFNENQVIIVNPENYAKPHYILKYFELDTPDGVYYSSQDGQQWGDSVDTTDILKWKWGGDDVTMKAEYEPMSYNVRLLYNNDTDEDYSFGEFAFGAAMPTNLWTKVREKRDSYYGYEPTGVYSIAGESDPKLIMDDRGTYGLDFQKLNENYYLTDGVNGQPGECVIQLNWRGKEYDVNLYKKNGSSITSKRMRYKTGAVLSEMFADTRIENRGYVLVGWKTTSGEWYAGDSDAAIEYFPDDEYYLNTPGSVYLYAVWGEIPDAPTNFDVLDMHLRVDAPKNADDEIRYAFTMNSDYTGLEPFNGDLSSDRFAPNVTYYCRATIVCYYNDRTIEAVSQPTDIAFTKIASPQFDIVNDRISVSSDIAGAGIFVSVDGKPSVPITTLAADFLCEESSGNHEVSVYSSKVTNTELPGPDELTPGRTVKYITQSVAQKKSIKVATCAEGEDFTVSGTSMRYTLTFTGENAYKFVSIKKYVYAGNDNNGMPYYNAPDESGTTLARNSLENNSKIDISFTNSASQYNYTTLDIILRPVSQLDDDEDVIVVSKALHFSFSKNERVY